MVAGRGKGSSTHKKHLGNVRMAIEIIPRKKSLGCNLIFCFADFRAFNRVKSYKYWGRVRGALSEGGIYSFAVFEILRYANLGD